MRKKTLIALCMLALTVGLIYAGTVVRREDAALSAQLQMTNEKATPYLQQIAELRTEIEHLRAGEDTDASGGTQIIYGFFASSADEIQSEGAIVLDADASPALIAAAKRTGREVLYFFDPEVRTPSGGAATILRSQNDSAENRAAIEGVISCFSSVSSAEMLADGKVNIPYIYIKNDAVDASASLNRERVLLVVLNPSAQHNYAELKEKMADGTIRETTVAAAKEYLLHAAEAEVPAEIGEQIAEKEAEIDALEKKLNEIYAGSRGEREGLQ